MGEERLSYRRGNVQGERMAIAPRTNGPVGETRRTVNLVNFPSGEIL
jgi:hypothetical protein